MKIGLRDCSGSVLMETVIVMPILLLLVFGIVQFALCWTARQMTVYAAFCAARAITVVSPWDDRQSAVENAAKIALSWVCAVDEPENETGVAIPGWGRIDGSGSANNRIRVEILANGDSQPFVATRVTFRYPLLIPGMAVNRIFGRAAGGSVNVNRKANFYGDLAQAASAPNDDGYGYPYMDFTETCVLPMPYSTRNFPVGGYDDMLSLGGSATNRTFRGSEW